MNADQRGFTGIFLEISERRRIGYQLSAVSYQLFQT